MKYITDFHKSRTGKLGASDIPTLIKHPERYDSLQGYGNTPLTLWQEKIGLRKREIAEYPAHMGHMLEPIVLYEFIRQNDTPEKADLFYKGYILCEADKTTDGYPTAPNTQYTEYLHHTEADNDFSVAHADCVKTTDTGYTLIEAKSANYWASRRKDDKYSGYDFDLDTHHGIPLKHFFQVQFQAALYQEVYGKRIDDGWLALLCDTNTFAQWHIRSDRRIQERLLELAYYMKKCIDKRVPPKNLAMNKTDIQIMYPKLDEDFRVVSGDELDMARKAAIEAQEAKAQLKAWKQKKEDAENALSVLLKNGKVLKGVVDGELQDIATWQERSGGERLVGLKEIEKDKRLYRYCKKNGLIKEVDGSRFIKVKFKGE